MWTIPQVATLVPKLDNPVGQCHRAVDEASMTLSRNSIEHKPIEGRFEGWRVDGGKNESYHWYIEIPHTQLHYDEAVILDPTVNQFRNAYAGADGVKTVVPDHLHPQQSILTQTDELYHAYCAVHPQSGQ